MSDTQRRAYRSVFTKELKSVEELIINHEELGEILARFDTLTITYEKLRGLDEQILQNVVSNPNVEEEEIEKEVSSTNVYNTKYHKISRQIQKLQSVDASENSSTKTCPNKLHLPKIELKKFDGELKNWIGFWSQFTKIHESISLGDEDKFDYLLQSMKIDSPPRKLIEGFPPSKENYKKAVELLKSRYGKDEFLIEYYVRELLALVLNRNDNLSVAYLYDKLEVQLRALESLGVTKEKYACMLFPLVETAIPEHIFKIWERYRVTKNASTKEPDNCLEELLQFLKTEVEAEERLRLRETSFGIGLRPNEKTNHKKDLGLKTHKTPSAAVLGLVTSENKPRLNKDYIETVNKNLCVFCGKTSHISSECFSIIEKTVSERIDLVKKKGSCLRCLRKGHLAQNCRVQVKCHICKGRHLAIFCQKVLWTKEPNEQEGLNTKEPRSIENTTNSLSTIENKSKTTYLQTLIAFIDYNGRPTKVRILCDSGSQKSFISSHCVHKIGLKSDGKVLIQQEVFGGTKTGPKHHNTHNISLTSLNFEFKINVQVIEQQTICNQVPQFSNSILMEKLKKKNIDLSDVSFSDKETTLNRPIDVLLGADAWAKIITSELHKIDDQLVAIRTQLGWTVVGSTNGDSSFVSTMFTSLQSSQDIAQFWNLETMGITEPAAKVKKEEKDNQVVESFEKTVMRDPSGRFSVRLPWVEDHPSLQSNKHVAEKRLVTTTRRLKSMNLYNNYDLILKEWFQKGIIERVENADIHSDTTRIHYLPHRAVVKEGSTTCIRPVFDASCKDKNGFCLNDCLEIGPNLIELVPKVLTNLRKYAFALISDIEKAFLQICVNPDDRDMLRFLWWENENIVVYRHTRVVFGLSCSPFLLGAVLKSLLRNAPNDLKPVAGKLLKSFYVDNCLTGVDEESYQTSLILQAQELLQLGKFNLRDWAGNRYLEPVDRKNIQNVLGLKWNCSEDTLFCNIALPFVIPEKLTRRSLLSFTQKIFDPIGFTAPVSLIPKVILQKTWNLKIGWDDKLPEDLQLEYYMWSKQIDCIAECKIPRRIVINNTSTLHVFCDASKAGFGSSIFLRTEISGTVRVSLILAKSRVSPTKQISLPRLELVGALTGVRLCTLAMQCLDQPDIPVYYWSDSSVTLAWIAKQGKWSVFVENRVKEINKFSNPVQWRYVPGRVNPADIVSRGCSPQQLLKSKWWNGPKWLYDPPNIWPTENPLPDQNIVDFEKKKSVTVISSVESFSIAENLGKRFSKYSSIVRTIAWMFRFTNKENRESDITSEEFIKSEKILFKLIQEDSFCRDKKNNPISGMQTFTEGGVIRLKSRLLNQEYSKEYTHPVVLPSNHVVVDRFIQQQHINYKHAGIQALLVILREKVWILKGRKTIGRVIHQCLPCKRNSSKPLQAPEASLPLDRTTLTSCFQVTGIDLAGPLITRKNKKCWVVIFTCAVYRAVHLELVPSLSTEAFILSLRRFIARRGRINVIYTDNGTNFVGLSNQLKDLDWTKVQNEFNLKNIIWKFNPPAAPWWGGFWERLVRILKELLRRNLGRASLSYEELNTLVCECEGVMNGRPLTYVSEDNDDLKPLTPSMFIQSIQGNDVSDLDLLEKISLNSRWKYILKVRQGLKRRFEKEYLGFIKSSKKGMKKLDGNISIGDVVLLHSEGKHRVAWPLGRVEEIIPGKDKVTRLVKVKTKNGIYLRPIQRLYPLEIKPEEGERFLQHQEPFGVPGFVDEDHGMNMDIENNKEVQISSSGRRIKKPAKLDL